MLVLVTDVKQLMLLTAVKCYLFKMKKNPNLLGCPVLLCNVVRKMLLAASILIDSTNALCCPSRSHSLLSDVGLWLRTPLLGGGVIQSCGSHSSTDVQNGVPYFY